MSTVQANFSDIGTRLATARTNAGLSQQEMADLMGVSLAQVQAAENGTAWDADPSNGGDGTYGSMKAFLRLATFVCNQSAGPGITTDSNTLHGGSWDRSNISALS